MVHKKHNNLRIRFKGEENFVLILFPMCIVFQIVIFLYLSNLRSQGHVVQGHLSCHWSWKIKASNEPISVNVGVQKVTIDQLQVLIN